VEAPGLKWAEKFKTYDAENPEVWELFKRFTFEVINAGRKHTSANMIFYRIRYETAVSTVGDRFKVNSAYTASYARKFEEDYPQHRGLFETRMREIAA
jgi:hypothetical protein